MTIDDMIRNEKLQYDIHREAAKISALSSRKIDKYEYLTCEEILLSNRIQIIEQAKFTYSRLEQALEKYIEKQVDAIKTLDFFNKIDELDQLKSIFPQKKFNFVIIDQLKEINHLQNIVWIIRQKVIFSANIHYLLFLRDTRG